MIHARTPVSSRRTAMTRTLSVGGVVVVLSCAAVWSTTFVTNCSLKVVDFEDVFKEEAASGASHGDHRPVLRVAVAAMISPLSTKHYYEDLLRAIGDSVDRRVVFAQRKTYSEVNDLLETKDIDIAFVCSGPYVAGHRQFGMEILAVPVVNGAKVYRSYILARSDSPVACLDDLHGKRFAFTDPKSNTGYLVPQYMLSRHGNNPARFFSQTSFTYGHDNSIKAVAEGVVDGAAVDHLIWEFLNATDPTYTRRTKVVEKSPPYGIPPVVVHPQLDPELKKRLRAAFLSLHEQPEAAGSLRRLRIDRFEEGDDAAYESVRDMEAWLEHRMESSNKVQTE